FIDDKIDKDTYDAQTRNVGTQLEKLNGQGSEPVVSEEQLEGLLEFAEWMLERIAGIWNSASFDNQLRIQNALFPEGLAVEQNGFGTAESSVLFRPYP